MKRFLLIMPALAIAMAGCTDTSRAHWAALGNAGRVTCFSGGRVILDDFSTGKIQNAGRSDGYEFKSDTTGRLEQVSGNCVVDYGATKGNDFKAVLP